MARDLPANILEQIFLHLLGDPAQFLAVRLVCHRWKTVADQKRSLWDRICIRIPEKVRLDRRFMLKSCAPANCIKLDRAEIITVNSWWPERFTFVEMRDCSVALGTLLGMLRRTPNLRQLVMRYTKYTCMEEPVVDFRLDKLEELRLYFDELLEVFVRICPKLRKISYDYPETWHDDVRDRLIQSVQGTLKDLEFYPTADLLQKMTSMNHLQLKRVKLFTFMQDHDEHDAVWLSRIQPSIEELIMPGVVAQSSTLCEIAHNLPQLKILDTCVEDASFLTSMPHLDKITLRGSKYVYTTNLPPHPNLKHAKFWYFPFDQTSLSSFLTGSPNLKTLSLNWCDFGQITSKIAPSLNLESLTLNAMEKTDQLWNLCRSLPRLATLRIEDCDADDTVNLVERILDRTPNMMALKRLEIGCSAGGVAYEEIRRMLEGRDNGISLDCKVVLNNS